jgi:Fe-Mn family superoxide dismutase
MMQLIDLPYEKNALAPVISAQTLEFHYGKHLQGYVDNLNKLLPGSGMEELPLEEIVKKSEGGMFNNAGQILNHNLYFTQFCPPGSCREPLIAGEDPRSLAASNPHCGLGPQSPLAAQIVKQWGSLDAFKAEFEAKGVTLFGSGWVWLSAQEDGSLVITQEPGANNPITKGLKPLLTFDVWEHAYYLDYQNRRAAHLSALWQIIDWKVIESRYNG